MGTYLLPACSDAPNQTSGLRCGSLFYPLRCPPDRAYTTVFAATATTAPTTRRSGRVTFTPTTPASHSRDTTGARHMMLLRASCRVTR